MVTTALDSSGQKPIESAIFTKLNKNEGLENHPEIGSCEGELLFITLHHLPDNSSCFNMLLSHRYHE